MECDPQIGAIRKYTGCAIANSERAEVYSISRPKSGDGLGEEVRDVNAVAGPGNAIGAATGGVSA